MLWSLKIQNWFWLTNPDKLPNWTRSIVCKKPPGANYKTIKNPNSRLFFTSEEWPEWVCAQNCFSTPFQTFLFPQNCFSTITPSSCLHTEASNESKRSEYQYLIWGFQRILGLSRILKLYSTSGYVSFQLPKHLIELNLPVSLNIPLSVVCS